MTTSTRPPLRIGLLVSSMHQPAWVCRIVREVAASDYARIAVVIENALPDADFRSAAEKIREHRNELLYILYRKIDDRLFRPSPDAFATADIRQWIPDVPVLRVNPIQKRFSDYFTPEDLAAIRGYDLDVALRFGFRILRGESLDIARHGVWSYHHGDNRVNRGGPAGFWEVMKGLPTTGSILQRLTEDLDNGHILYRSMAQTDPISVRRNRNNYFWKSSAFMPRKLRQLRDEGPAALSPPQEETTFRAYSTPLYVKPSNGRMAKNLTRLWGRALLRRLELAVSFRQWFVAYRIKRHPADMETSIHRFRYMTPPRDRFWADPFPIYENGRHYIFLEELLYERGKGWISVVELDDKGNWSKPRKVLETPYHLSYPFLFRHQGGLYLMPETAQNRTVEVYRCRSFPDQWEPAAVVMEGVDAVDATLHHDGELWWMFVNIAEPGASLHDELHLFHAASPLGPWVRHRRNPVKSDVRSARPAGNLFRWNGRLYRPGQDCSTSYGSAISINLVERLDRDEYVEREVSRIEPSWKPGVLCTHTFNENRGLTVIDGRWRRRRFP